MRPKDIMSAAKRKALSDTALKCLSCMLGKKSLQPFRKEELIEVLKMLGQVCVSQPQELSATAGGVSDGSQSSTPVQATDASAQPSASGPSAPSQPPKTVDLVCESIRERKPDTCDGKCGKHHPPDCHNPKCYPKRQRSCQDWHSILPLSALLSRTEDIREEKKQDRARARMAKLQNENRDLRRLVKGNGHRGTKSASPPKPNKQQPTHRRPKEHQHRTNSAPRGPYPSSDRRRGVDGRNPWNSKPQGEELTTDPTLLQTIRQLAAQVSQISKQQV